MLQLFHQLTEKLVTPILIFLLILALFVGLSPFSFFSKNNVNRLSGRDGIYLNPPQGYTERGIIHTEDRINFTEINHTNVPGLSIELWLKAKYYYRHSLGSLLTLEDGRDPVVLFLGQWNSSLIIRIRDRSEGKGYKEIGVRDALLKDQETFITINSCRAGIKIYINGVLQRSYPDIALIDSTVDAVQLIAGASVSGKSRWRGELYGMAFLGDTLSTRQVNLRREHWYEGNYEWLEMESKPLLFYPFNEKQGKYIYNQQTDRGHWLIPSHFRIIRKPFLGGVMHGDLQINGPFIEDIVINLSGFILLGYFMALFIGRRVNSKLIVVLTVLFLCSLFSLGIEFSQIYLPQRDSSLLDFLLNSAGSLIGGGIFLYVEEAKG